MGRLLDGIKVVAIVVLLLFSARAYGQVPEYGEVVWGNAAGLGIGPTVNRYTLSSFESSVNSNFVVASYAVSAGQDGMRFNGAQFVGGFFNQNADFANSFSLQIWSGSGAEAARQAFIASPRVGNFGGVSGIAATVLSTTWGPAFDSNRQRGFYRLEFSDFFLPQGEYRVAIFSRSSVGWGLADMAPGYMPGTGFAVTHTGSTTDYTALPGRSGAGAFTLNYVVPAPGSAAALGFGGLLAFRRKR